MKFVIKHIEELLDFFPINPITLAMRHDLIEATQQDYDAMIESGTSPEEASSEVIGRIASPETFATMIPNTHTKSYFIYWFIAIVTTVGVFSYITTPDFLQIFLPARMEFPDIIEKFILYFFAVLIFYALMYSLSRFLPQKYLTRTPFQSMCFLYAGTIMASLYFSIAMAFVWYTFNGFNPNSITFDLISTFIYSFYKIFFSSHAIVVVYAFVNAALFVFSRQSYHLEKQPQPYVFEHIYQAKTKKETEHSAAFDVTMQTIAFLKSSH